jgi:hypothetical protein
VQVGDKFTPKNEQGTWQAQYHTDLYKLTDEAVRCVSRGPENFALLLASSDPALTMCWPVYFIARANP